MRVFLTTVGWALALAGLGLLAAGIIAAAPTAPLSGFSAAEQMALQRWSLARAFEGLALGFAALTAGFATLILARLTPPEGQ